MRVLVATTNLAPTHGSATAAAGNAVRLVVQALGEQVSGTVIAPAAQGQPMRERAGGLEVRRVRPRRPEAGLADAMRGAGAVRALATSAAMVAAVRRELTHGGYDVVHAFWAFPAGFAAVWPGVRVPVVVSAPGSDVHTWSSSRLVATALTRPDRVVVHSAGAAGRVREVGARSVVQVPVPIDLSVFGVSGPQPLEPVVAYAGRLTAQKGTDVLADALRMLASRVEGLSFECCGGGPDADRFADAVRAALGSRARFHGPLDPRGVAGVMSRARVTVLPSFGEGMAAAALESLSVGRPVVTTAVGGHADLVARGGGRVVEPGDAAALADALELELRTHRDPAQLSMLVEHCTPHAVAGRYLNLYSEVSRTPIRATLASLQGGMTR